MKPIFYFLRSSEQKIVTDMLYYAMGIDEAGKSLDDLSKLKIYEEFYGFTSKDLGLYALVDNRLAGAAWIRRLNADHGSNGYIDDNTPILKIAVIPEFRRCGIGSQMMEQLFVEAGALYDQISVSVLQHTPIVDFYLRHGFLRYDDALKTTSPVSGEDTFILVKKLDRKEVKRPNEGYDPRRWME